MDIHDGLVLQGVRWLRAGPSRYRCSNVFSELHTAAGLVPDVIGFAHTSVLVEVKVSRSDFFRDRKKRHHLQPSVCPGNRRLYLTPPGLVQLGELPKGWGLIELTPSGIEMRLEAEYFEVEAEGARAERMILQSAISRLRKGMRFTAKTGRFEPYPR